MAMGVDAPKHILHRNCCAQQSRPALRWLNFFLAGKQTAFDLIAAAYLAAQQWTAKDIGYVPSIGGVAGLVSQVPGGKLLDAARAKRRPVAAAVVIVALSTLMFRLRPSFPVVATAQVFQDVTGGVLGPGVSAITLGLVGHGALAQRLRLNQRLRRLRGRRGYVDNGACCQSTSRDGSCSSGRSRRAGAYCDAPHSRRRG